MRDSSASQALAGVRVTLVEGPNTGLAVDTNAQGRYEFRDLLTGTFVLQFSKDGYSAARRTGSMTGDIVLDVTLESESPPRYTLSGMVRTPWNEPLFDVGVEAVADGRVRGGSTTTTSGAYNMPGLAPADYVVRVAKWGYYAPDMQMHLTGDSRLDFVMDRGKWVVRGSVEESPPCVAQPVRGATVRVLDSPDAPDAGASVTTSSTGEYRFDALRWGVITLQASRSGYVTVDMTIKLPSPGYPDPTGHTPVTANLRLTPVSGTCGTTS